MTNLESIFQRTFMRLQDYPDTLRVGDVWLKQEEYDLKGHKVSYSFTTDSGRKFLVEILSEVSRYDDYIGSFENLEVSVGNY